MTGEKAFGNFSNTTVVASNGVFTMQALAAGLHLLAGRQHCNCIV